MMMEPEIIQRFLESVGQKADIQLYLNLFRAQRKESFAVIAADAQIVRTALDPLHFDLRILAGLDLRPVVLLGLFDARDADRNAQRVHEWLAEDGVPSQIVPFGPAAPEVDAIRETIAEQKIPLVSLQAAGDLAVEGRFALLETLTRALETRKVVFLSTGTGLEKAGSPRLSVVNLESDYDALVRSPTLSRRHQQLLRRVKALLHSAPHRMSVTVTNPLSLLRELFTVNGAGTLIRTGSRVERHDDLCRIDHQRLVTLIESAFGRGLLPGALEQHWERVYLEENYRGAALLTRTPAGIYLSKFAVERPAQGEGIGGDLWTAMLRDYPRVYWRARPDNPINPWYTRKCDALMRFANWHVFFCGMAPADIPAAVEHALSLPPDLEPPPPPEPPAPG